MKEEHGGEGSSRKRTHKELWTQQPLREYLNRQLITQMRDGYSRTQYTEDGHKLVEKSRMCFGHGGASGIGQSRRKGSLGSFLRLLSLKEVLASRLNSHPTHLYLCCSMKVTLGWEMVNSACMPSFPKAQQKTELKYERSDQLPTLSNLIYKVLQVGLQDQWSMDKTNQYTTSN